MAYLIYILIVAVNITPFLIPKLDIWHAQGVGVQVCALAIFSWMFFQRPKFCEPQNKALGFIFLWTGLLTAFICFKSQLGGKYEILRFFPFFNLLCLGMIYKGITTYLTAGQIVWVYRFLRWSVIVTLLMCVLQKLGMSQFYQLFTPDNKFNNNIVTGFIGNGTHLSGFLGMCVPLFFLGNKRENILCLVLMGIILCLFTGTGQNDVSMSGIVVAIAVTGYFFLRTKRNVLIGTGICLLGLLIFLGLPNDIRSQFLCTNGRDSLWAFYFDLSKRAFITGQGLGSVDLIYQKTPFPDFRHVHFEYLQFLFEGGILLITAIIYFVKDLLERKTSHLGLVFKAMFLGFLISGVFNYPMHLWLPSTYACIAYSCLIAFNERRLCYIGGNCACYKKTD